MKLLGLILAAALLTTPTAASAKTITFKSSCLIKKRIYITAVGDLLFHKKLQVQAYRKNGSFRKFFKPMLAELRIADFTYGNLEGPAARGVAGFGRSVKDTGKRYGRVYGAPLKSLSFNYHPSVVNDLLWVGFDIVSTANNHALDRGPLGIDRTIEKLEKTGLLFTGTRKQGETIARRQWSVITKNDKATIAWLACSFSTNGLPDRKKQVLRCFKDRQVVLDEIKRLASDPDINAVILTPHWGNEGSLRAGRRAKVLARQVIDAGALAVLGSHPHVLQPWEKHVTKDGREGLIIYSMGNYISNQRRLMERAGVLAFLELAIPDSGKARIAKASFLPTWVIIDGKGHRVTLNRGRGWAGGALKRTMTLLPSGNAAPGGKLDKTFKPCAG